MNKFFKRISLILLGLTIFLGSVAVPVEAYTNTSARVGLFYSSTSKTSYSVEGSNLKVAYNEVDIISSGENNLSVSTISQIFTQMLGYMTYEEAKLESLVYGVSGLVFFDGKLYYPGAVSFHNNLSANNSQKNIYVRTLSGEKLITPGNYEVKISSSDLTIKLENKSYRGDLGFLYSGSNLNAINQLNLDEYLYSVVPSEMPASWELEALKAQAVVARNYALTNYNKHKSEGFNVCATTHCQVYNGYSNEHVNSNKAVDLTSGESIYHNGALVEGYFHSSSGGRTENSENIWSSALPYLKGVYDPYSIGNPHDNWDVIITASEVKSSLYANGIDVGDIFGMKITKVSGNGRALELSILGSKGVTTLHKERIRTVLGSSKFKSTYITLKGDTLESEVTENISNQSLKNTFGKLANFMQTMETNTDFVSGPVFYFSGKGYGHGVGMSQYGAREMAKQGYNYKEILKHYFTGVDIY